MNKRIILGIDPGTNLMGYGVINAESTKPILLIMGVLELSKIKDPYEKLQKIFEKTVSIIKEHHVSELAIEAPFFGKNVQSMLKLGRAQGVAIAAALHCSLPVFEYAPRKIKMSITGQGDASKEQVAGLLQHILQFKDIPKNLDATDGVAAAVCHFFQNRMSDNSTPVKSWKEFIAKNPGRMKG